MDREFTETFVMRGFAGDVRHDPGEVAETAYWTKDRLQAAVAAEPHKFAIWFRAELDAIDLAAL
jgi:isopentenyldiphosphate isomerase